MRTDTEKRPPGARELNPEALGLLQRFGAQMLATARRYSASTHDAEDAYQRAAEILLTHRPTGTDDELCRWLRTTTKHEALAINRHRDRVVPAGESESVPEPAGGTPDAHDHAERLERLQLCAEALRRLKPQEVRCLLLKAEGYSYQEICETTGFSFTKVNGCLTEGRRSFLEPRQGIGSRAERERLPPQLPVLAAHEAGASGFTSFSSLARPSPICVTPTAYSRFPPVQPPNRSESSAVARTARLRRWPIV